MLPEIDDLTLSQLADGELPREQIAATLLAVLESESRRERLQQHLQLRDMTSAWRAQAPRLEQPFPSPAPAAPVTAPRRAAWHPGSVLAASVLSGLLVLAGVWVGSSLPRSRTVVEVEKVPAGPDRQVISKVFAFHESVAGPLKAFAADDTSVELAPADDDSQAAAPVAMILRLSTGEGKTPHDYVIVCRQDVPVTIPLPHGDDGSPSGRLFVSPGVQKDGVGLRYSLTVDDRQRNAAPAVIAGRRTVGNDFRSLGEVALGDQRVRIEASA